MVVLIACWLFYLPVGGYYICRPPGHKLFRLFREHGRQQLEETEPLRPQVGTFTLLHTVSLHHTTHHHFTTLRTITLPHYLLFLFSALQCHFTTPTRHHNAYCSYSSHYPVTSLHHAAYLLCNTSLNFLLQVPQPVYKRVDEHKRGGREHLPHVQALHRAGNGHPRHYIVQVMATQGTTSCR